MPIEDRTSPRGIRIVNSFHVVSSRSAAPRGIRIVNSFHGVSLKSRSLRGLRSASLEGGGVGLQSYYPPSVWRVDFANSLQPSAYLPSVNHVGMTLSRYINFDVAGPMMI